MVASAMSKERSRDLVRECVAFGAGVVLAAAMIPLVPGGYGPAPMTAGHFRLVVAAAVFAGFVAVPFFLINALFIWPPLRDRLSGAGLVVAEIVLLGAGWVLAALVWTRPAGWAWQPRNWIYGGIAYAFCRIGAAVVASARRPAMPRVARNPGAMSGGS